MLARGGGYTRMPLSTLPARGASARTPRSTNSCCRRCCAGSGRGPHTAHGLLLPPAARRMARTDAAGILIMLAVALSCGMWNGALVAFARINAFVATLAGMTIYHGIALVVTDSFPGYALRRVVPQLRAGVPLRAADTDLRSHHRLRGGPHRADAHGLRRVRLRRGRESRGRPARPPVEVRQGSRISYRDSRLAFFSPARESERDYAAERPASSASPPPTPLNHEIPPFANSLSNSNTGETASFRK